MACPIIKLNQIFLLADSSYEMTDMIPHVVKHGYSMYMAYYSQWQLKDQATLNAGFQAAQEV